MSEALRAVFAEFGFDVDLPTLEKLDAKLKETIGTTKKQGKAVDETAKAQNEAAKQAKKDYDELGKKLSTYAGILDHLDDKFHEAFGKNIAGRFKSVDALAQRFGVTNQGIGKIVAGASAVAVASLAAATRAAFAFADAFAADAEALRDTARESRVTTTELQGLDHAAVQAGVGVERMRAGVQTFGAALRQGERWGNSTTSTLRRLGITVRDANGHIRPTVELMDESAVALQRIENPTRRLRVATQLYGDSARRMLDVLRPGPGGIRALREELDELGGGVTPEAIEAARLYTAATGRLKVAQDSLRSVLATALLPALSWLLDKGAKVAGMLSRLTRGTHVVQIALAALGVVGAAVAAALIAAWLPAAAPYLAIAAAVGVLVLVLDDLITFAEGGDSAVGRLIDHIFGLGAAATEVQGLRLEWAYLKDVLQLVSDLMHDIWAVANPSALYQTARAALGLSHEEAPKLRTGSGGAFANFNRARAAAGQGVDPGGAAQNRAYAAYSQTVVAPAGMGRANYTKVVRHGDMHFHGITDTNAITARVGEQLRRADAQERDGNHPQRDDE